MGSFLKIDRPAGFWQHLTKSSNNKWSSTGNVLQKQLHSISTDEWLERK